MMLITKELGQKIISRIGAYTDVDINIINLDGVIVSSTDTSRIDQIHYGAIEVIKTKKSLTITDENIDNYKGTKQGINMPILHRGKIAGVVGVSGQPDDLNQITGLVRASVEIVLEQLYFQQQVYDQERRWNYWLQQVLHPRGYDERELAEEAKYSLQIDVHKGWRILVVYGDETEGKLHAVKRALEELYVEPLFVLMYLEKEIVIAVDESVQQLDTIAQQIIKATGKSIRIGIGEVYDGIAGIRESYNEAKQVLTLSEGIEVISYSKDWELARLVSSIPETEFDRICTIYKERLNKLEDYYLETIDTYFAMNLSIKETANRLHIHRNTLLYRLEQVKEKVGLDPRFLFDALFISIIRLYKK